jgi:hypothetical protein
MAKQVFGDNIVRTIFYFIDVQNRPTDLLHFYNAGPCIVFKNKTYENFESN